MPSTTCPGCGRNTSVRRDGCFVKHANPDTRERCGGSESDATIPFAEAALRTAEHRASTRRKVVDNRIAGRAAHIAAYDADTETARVMADHCDADVEKARTALAALVALRGAP